MIDAIGEKEKIIIRKIPPLYYANKCLYRLNVLTHHSGYIIIFINSANSWIYAERFFYSINMATDEIIFDFYAHMKNKYDILNYKKYLKKLCKNIILVDGVSYILSKSICEKIELNLVHESFMFYVQYHSTENVKQLKFFHIKTANFDKNDIISQMLNIKLKTKINIFNTTPNINDYVKKLKSKIAKIVTKLKCDINRIIDEYLTKTIKSELIEKLPKCLYYNGHINLINVYYDNVEKGVYISSYRLFYYQEAQNSNIGLNDLIENIKKGLRNLNFKEFYLDEYINNIFIKYIIVEDKRYDLNISIESLYFHIVYQHKKEILLSEYIYFVMLTDKKLYVDMILHFKIKYKNYNIIKDILYIDEFLSDIK